MSFALSITGQQYFANGSGIAYFDDNSTSKFEHEMTQQNGWYYDNKTVFYVGEIPGVSTANNVKCSGGYSDTTGNSTIITNNNNISQATNHTLTIINGADVIENKSKAILPSPIITIRAGDTVTWTNNDATTHIIRAPPGNFMFEGKIPYGQSFDTILSGTTSPEIKDRSFSCTFTEPGGFQYDVDNSNNRIVGAVIVEKG
jgi:plastocyanin